MATIEQLRALDDEHQRHHSTLYSDAACPGDSPSKVLLRVSHRPHHDAFWLTADGELHFGARALAGLTRHVIEALYGARLAHTYTAMLKDAFGAEPGRP